MLSTKSGTFGPEAGFSLIEVLVSVAILSLLSLALITASSGTSTLLHRGLISAQKTSRTITTQEKLSDLLAAALKKSQFSGAIFYGEKKSMRWTARPGSFPSVSEVLEFELAVEPEVNSQSVNQPSSVLKLRWLKPDSPEIIGETILVREAQGIEFEYYLSPTSQNGITALPVTEMPYSVRLHSGMQSAPSALSIQGWPDLLVRLRHK